MKQKDYNKVSGFVFLVVAVAHAVRAYNGWNLTVAGNEIPLWASWVAVALTGYLAYQGTKSK